MHVLSVDHFQSSKLGGCPPYFDDWKWSTDERCIHNEANSLKNPYFNKGWMFSGHALFFDQDISNVEDGGECVVYGLLSQLLFHVFAGHFNLGVHTVILPDWTSIEH